MSVFQLIKNNDLSNFKEFIDAYPNSLSEANQHGFTPLMYSLHYNKPDFASHCLTHGHKNALKKRDWSGRQSTALHLAATKGYFNIVAKIIKIDGKIKEYDGLGHSATSLCYKHGHYNIGHFLDGLWFKRGWYPSLHKSCPPEFQLEVTYLLLILKHIEKTHNLNFYKDLKFLIINNLLNLHKKTYYTCFDSLFRMK